MIRYASLFCAIVGIGLLLPTSASAAGCELEITGGDDMKYDKESMTASADCDEITVTLTHSGEMGAQQMGHNWVLTESDDFQEVAQAGQSTSLEQDYLPEDQSAIIAATEIIGGGEQTSVTFDGDAVEAGGDYTFFCSFPGHWGQMQGTFSVE